MASSFEREWAMERRVIYRVTKVVRDTDYVDIKIRVASS